jgi:hypothetical protein
VSSDAASQSSQISGADVSDDRRRLLGAVGAFASLAGGVVTVSVLLSAAFPDRSRAITLNTCVLDGWK